MDLTDWDATRKAVEGVGPIHLLVNNAGVAEITPFLETTKAEMDRYIFQNLRLRGGGGGVKNTARVSNNFEPDQVRFQTVR